VNQRWPVRAAIGTLVALPMLAAGFATSSQARAHRSAAAEAGHHSTPVVLRPSYSAATTPSSPSASASPALPARRKARPIIGHYRVVAYYGGPDGPALGTLGNGTPDRMAIRIQQSAAIWSHYGKPVLPAMELIATVAQGSPGSSGTYSHSIPATAVQRYLAAAHRHHMLLILDFQPGRGEFLPQVQAMSQFLLDPSVSVALDPEWKLGPHQVPATVIGSSSAASIDAVIRYVSSLVLAHHLPDKLLLVHQFRLSMLPDRGRISAAPGVELVLHADGFGTPGEKLATWNAMDVPGRPWGTGFKLFLKQDRPMLLPAQVVAMVRPAPDVITYQ
jgi:hypothetical protein